MPKHVKEVFAGTSGILSGLCSEKIWIDHSTTDYNQVKQLIFIERVLHYLVKQNVLKGVGLFQFMK